MQNPRREHRSPGPAPPLWPLPPWAGPHQIRLLARCASLKKESTAGRVERVKRTTRESAVVCFSSKCVRWSCNRDLPEPNLFVVDQGSGESVYRAPPTEIAPRLRLPEMRDRAYDTCNFLGDRVRGAVGLQALASGGARELSETQSTTLTHPRDAPRIGAGATSQAISRESRPRPDI